MDKYMLTVHKLCHVVEFFHPKVPNIVWISLNLFHLVPDLKAPPLYETLTALDQIPALCNLKWKIIMRDFWFLAGTNPLL